MAPSTTFSTAFSRSQSAATYAGSLPPSSRPTWRKRFAAACLDAVAAEDRAGEEDVVDPRVADDPLARRVVAVERLDELLRRAGGGERAREVLAAERAARRVLEDDGVAGEHRGDDARSPR